MSLPLGTHQLGPDNATLSIRTKRTGAAAKAGHDLLVHVTSWSATLVADEGPAQTSIELVADATSLRVIEGTGGMQALGEDDITNIQQTIDDEVLKGREITFRSTGARGRDDVSRISVEGDLTILDQTNPIAFELAIAENGALSATAVVTQTTWGMEPYSALFGALKVADEVEVAVEGKL